MELHFVHKGANGKLLVIGIFYEYGRGSFFLQKVKARSWVQALAATHYFRR
jgi:carbonic anhydrase